MFIKLEGLHTKKVENHFALQRQKAKNSNFRYRILPLHVYLYHYICIPLNVYEYYDTRSVQP